jgi:folate-binding protein YgfZ
MPTLMPALLLTRRRSRTPPPRRRAGATTRAWRCALASACARTRPCAAARFHICCLSHPALRSGGFRRTQALGWRAVLPRDAPPAADAAGDAYDAHRMALGVAEGAELSGELPLELNLDALGAISFTKGCYVGQELTSRTHFRGVIRKRAMPVAFASAAAAAAAAPGQAVLPAGGGAPVGRLLAAQGGRGVALLRLAGALPAAAGAPPPALVLEEPDGAALAARRPHWWPPAWGTPA